MHQIIHPCQLLSTQTEKVLNIVSFAVQANKFMKSYDVTSSLIILALIKDNLVAFSFLQTSDFFYHIKCMFGHIYEALNMNKKTNYTVCI